MKTIAIYFVLMFWATVTNAQEITVLNEARVDFEPISLEVTSDGDSYSFVISEKFRGEFENNPIRFTQKHFNIQNFISEVQHRNFDSYEVTFKSSRGSFWATFDEGGNLKKSSHRFKDVILPDELRHQLYRDYKGWKMVKNLHIAKGENGLVKKDFYKIELQNGKETKRIKIDADKPGEVEVASK